MLRILKYAFIVSLVCAFVFRVRNLTSTRVILVVYVLDFALAKFFCTRCPFIRNNPYDKKHKIAAENRRIFLCRIPE